MNTMASTELSLTAFDGGEFTGYLALPPGGKAPASSCCRKSSA
jgi:hypothetical protein